VSVCAADVNDRASIAALRELRRICHAALNRIARGDYEPGVNRSDLDSRKPPPDPAQREHSSQSSPPVVTVAPSGARAALTARIIARIESDFAEPKFSTRVLAKRFGMSARYIQALLKDQDLGVSDRIKELRLCKAQAMLLADPGCALKISDVALSCGFNELSYFHRCFRKRFGASPAKFRERAVRRAGDVTSD